MTNDFLAFQILDAFDLGQRDEAVIPDVLGLREVGQPLLSLGPLAIGLVMQTAEKIDFSGQGEFRSVRHSRRFGPADNMEIDFEAVFFHDPRFFKDKEEG